MYLIGDVIIVWKDGIQFIGKIWSINFQKEEYTIYTKDKKDIIVSFHEYIDFIEEKMR